MTRSDVRFVGVKTYRSERPIALVEDEIEPASAALPLGLDGVQQVNLAYPLGVGSAAPRVDFGGP